MSSQWNHQQEKIMKLMLSLVCLLQGVSSLRLDCPTFAELGSSTHLICFETQSNMSLVSWTRPDNALASICNGLGCDGRDGYTVSRNSSHSKLKILEVGEKDIGTWTCSTRIRLQCTVEGYKTPSCDITNDNDANMLALNDQLVLLVNIDDYYCSRGSSFTLQIGNVTETSFGTDGNITDKTFVVNLNVMERHFGSVELAFLCHNKHIPLRCTGLREIVHKRQMKEVTADPRSRPSTSFRAMVGAVVAGSVAVTINIVLVVVLVKMKQSKRSQQPETHSGRNVYDSPNDVDGQTDETSGHEYNTLYLTPVEGGNIYNVIST
ncbi:uncharacterized protein LOC124126191 [Haliotis rufescens]|uniref:uncharacterized protein LOC124126191 n=1 Tax=Haliotis rufescens TaxID=6454 RepID=UPI00201E8835|nr:uncharacterized protein LOC124126191 [Haliotis rufescens]